MKNLSIWYLCFIIAFCIFVGCNTPKQIQRKDNAAVERVNAKSSLQTPVVNEWIKAHPQDTSTKIIITPGKNITVYQDRIIKDTTGHWQHTIDSILASNIDCGEAAKNAYDLGYTEAENEYLKNPITVKCPPDTTKTYFLSSEIKRLQDSSNKKESLIQYKNGRLDAKDEQLKKQDKKYNTLLLICGALLVVSVLSHMVRSYLPSIKLPKI